MSAAVFPVPAAEAASINDREPSSSEWMTTIEEWTTTTKHGVPYLSLLLKEPLPEKVPTKRPLSTENLGDYSGLWAIALISTDRKTVDCLIQGEFPPKREWELRPVYCDGSGEVNEASESGTKSSSVNTHQQSPIFTQMGSKKQTRLVICDRKDRPNKPPIVRLAPCLTFSCRATLITISAVDTVAQTFDADIVCEFKLMGLSLCQQQNAAEEALGVYGIYADMFQILNGGATSGETDRWANFEPCGSIPGSYSYTFKFRTKGSFSEELELMSFPFDVQSLSVSVALTKPCSLAKFIVNYSDPSVYNYGLFMLNNIYMVIFKDILIANLDMSDPMLSSSNFIFPQISYRVLFLRRPQYYLSNIASPVMILTVMSFLSFVVESDGSKLSIADRLSVTLTLLLTSVAYKFVVASSLPQVSYLTYLDFYVLTCFGVQVLIALLNVLFPYLEYRASILGQSVEFVSNLEYYVVVVLLVMYLVGNIVLRILTRHWMSQRYNRKLVMLLIEITRRVVASFYRSRSRAEQELIVKYSLEMRGITLAQEFIAQNSKGPNAPSSFSSAAKEILEDLDLDQATQPQSQPQLEQRQQHEEDVNVNQSSTGPNTTNSISISRERRTSRPSISESGSEVAGAAAAADSVHKYLGKGFVPTTAMTKRAINNSGDNDDGRTDRKERQQKYTSTAVVEVEENWELSPADMHMPTCDYRLIAAKVDAQVKEHMQEGMTQLGLR